MPSKTKKYKFFKNEIKFLGNIVTEGKVITDPDKIEAIAKYEQPDVIKWLRSVLGLANYIRDYIPRFAELSAPLFELFKDEPRNSVKAIKWNEGRENCFKKLKNQIIAITYKAQPNFEKEFILTADASEIFKRAVVTQKKKALNRWLEHIVINSAQHKKYSVTEKELLGLVKGIDHYLLGGEFLLRADHRLLEYLWSTKQ